VADEAGTVFPVIDAAFDWLERRWPKHESTTVMCDHITGHVIWAATGRSKDTVGKFFDALGDRADRLEFVTADADQASEAAELRSRELSERRPTQGVGLPVIGTTQPPYSDHGT
jgi:hypothetical protein